MSNSVDPPKAGMGLHEWILAFTRSELAIGKSEVSVKDEVWKLTQANGRKPETLKREIDDAVKGAVKWLADHPLLRTFGGRGSSRGWNWENRDYDGGSQGIRRPPPPNKWQLPVNQRLIAKILARRWPMLKPRIYFNLGELYGGFNFPICIATEVNKPKARPLRYWQDRWELRSAQWIVPNPCLRCGNGGGVKSDANAGERLWLIIEFDSGGLEEQAKLLMWLDRIDAEWDLGLIVYSGSKSLHGWFSCVDKSEHGEIFTFFKRATSLGCDRSMRSSVQYTRMPLGMNSKTGRRQDIVHWSEDAIFLHTEKLEASQKEEY